MGYMGLGMQRWISNMKPRKFFGKRTKPDGGGGEKIVTRNIDDYYQLKSQKLTHLLKKKYSFSYRKKLTRELEEESGRYYLKNIFGFLIALAIVILLFIYFNNKLDWF